MVKCGWLARFGYYVEVLVTGEWPVMHIWWAMSRTLGCVTREWLAEFGDGHLGGATAFGDAGRFMFSEDGVQ